MEDANDTTPEKTFLRGIIWPLIRVLLASYLAAAATAIVFDPASSVLLTTFLPYDFAATLTAAVLFGASLALLFGRFALASAGIAGTYVVIDAIPTLGVAGIHSTAYFLESLIVLALCGLIAAQARRQTLAAQDQGPVAT